MTKSEYKQKLDAFYERMRNYRALLSRSRNQVVEIVANHEEIAQERSALTRAFGAIDGPTRRLGRNPQLSDIGGGPYSAYDIALSTQILQRRGPCIDAVIQDVELILGRIDGMDEGEFAAVVYPSRTTAPTAAPSAGISAGGSISAGGDIIVGANMVTPRATAQKKDGSVKQISIAVAGSVIAAAIIYQLGWN